MMRKLGIVIMVVLALGLAGCTTSTAKPTGIMTGLTAKCTALSPPVKVVLYSGSTLVASATVPAGSRYRLSVPAGLYKVIGGEWGPTATIKVRPGRTVILNSPLLNCQ
jgi:hypothetical protein